MSTSQPIVAVFGASRTIRGDGDYLAAERCGRLLAEAGYGVVTGGYGGSMEAVSRGAALAGGRVVAVTAPEVFPDRPGANEFVGEEIAAPTLSERIHRLIDMSAASIALAGSIGTLTELMVAWNLAFVARLSSAPPKPVVAIGRRWESIVTDLAGRFGTDGTVVDCVPDVDTAVRVVADALGPAT